MKRGIAWALAAILLCVAMGSANAKPRESSFKAPLQVPAKKSAIAGSSPLIGLARAGKRLVAVGEHGYIVFSDDQGKHWTQAPVPVSVDLTAVYFPTPDQGWAVGQSGVILHSTDGGRSWHLQMNGWRASKLLVRYYKKKTKTGSGTKYARILSNVEFLARSAPALGLLDVWFKNTQVGYVVGEFGITLRTTDGGKTWMPWGDHVQNPGFRHLYSITGSKGHVYIAGESGIFLRLDRQSHEFVAVKTPYRGSYFGVAARGSRVVIFGLQGHAYISRNTGETWHKVAADTNSTFSAGTIDREQIVLVTESGRIFYSRGHGERFTAVPVAHRRPIYNVVSLTRNKLALVGASGLWIESLHPAD
jgi:photosystem II stability/assembly factor-like uncharacterized protein